LTIEGQQYILKKNHEKVLHQVELLLGVEPAIKRTEDDKNGVYYMIHNSEDYGKNIIWMVITP